MKRHLLVLCVSVAGCGGGTMAGGDGGPGNDASTTTDAGPGHDAGAGTDAGPGLDAWSSGNDAGVACMPSVGSMVFTAGCDLFQLAVIDHDGAPSDLILTGRIFATSAAMPSCAVIDGVDIVQSNATSPVVQHLAGGETFLLDSGEHELARGVPVAAISGACASDDPAMRFDSYGIVIHGRVDGGTFEAHCARAEGGGRWPPALRITCHRNVEQPPNSGNAMVNSTTFMGMTYRSTMLFAAANHGPSGALTSVGSTIHIIARRSIFDTGAPIPSHDTTGWMGSANESGSTPSYSQLQANAQSAQFDTTLCPPPMTGLPGPGYIPPPVFLARLTGSGGHGAYSTEVFVNQCYTTGH